MADPRVHVQYASFESQTHAARLGTWLLLVSEVLLFAGLFTLYASYRTAYPQVFAEAVGHARLYLGSAMTLLLVTSSLTVALAVHELRSGAARGAGRWLLATLGLGALFLALKGYEYHTHVQEGALPGVHYHFEKLQEPGAALFFTLYYLMTGLHALHVAAGLLYLCGVAWAIRRGRVSARYPTSLEMGGLYWHLVDVIWLFLWPLFYLMR